MYVLYVYENKTKNPVEIVLRNGRGGYGRLMEEVNLIKIHCKHI
jgi:hypothetical protein